MVGSRCRIGEGVGRTLIGKLKACMNSAVALARRQTVYARFSPSDLLISGSKLETY